MPIVTIHTSRRAAKLATYAGALALLVALPGCDANDRLLNAKDPDIINPIDVDSPDGAEALRVGALDRWRLTTGGDNVNGNDNTWLFGGLLADEWATASTFVQNDEVDERNIRTNNSTVTFAFRKLNRVRTAVNQAIPAMRKHWATETTKIAELYLARGFAELQIASDFCNGIPLSDATGDEIVYGSPRSVAEIFDIAIATLDSGLAELGTASDANAVSVRNALHVARARALLGVDRVAEAGAEVAAIPRGFSYDHTYAASSGDNAIWGQPRGSRRYNVGSSIEGNAHDIVVANQLSFFTANDPRVPASYTISTSGDTTKSQDGDTYSRTTTIYARETPVAVANFVDARLIIAEALLRAGNPQGMLDTLNALRANPPRLGEVQPAAMAPLTLPATTAGQVDLLFREKAFWTFSRGQRLGDLRRLIRFYGRTPANTFPTGEHYRGGNYGSDVNLPVPQEEENNPNFTGCTDRNA